MLKVITPPAATPEALDPAATVTLLGAAAAEQSRIQEIIQDATRVAETVARRRLWYRVYEELLTGDGADRLYLQVRPIASVTSIAFATDDPLVEGSESDQFEIWADDGFLYREAGWLVGSPGWRCRYAAGWWLPSMGAPGAGASDIAVDGRHVRKPIEDIVRATYERDGQDATVKRERVGGAAPIEYEFRDGVWIPETALAVLERLAPIAP